MSSLGTVTAVNSPNRSSRVRCSVPLASVFTRLTEGWSFDGAATSPRMPAHERCARQPEPGRASLITATGPRQTTQSADDRSPVRHQPGGEHLTDPAAHSMRNRRSRVHVRPHRVRSTNSGASHAYRKAGHPPAQQPTQDARATPRPTCGRRPKLRSRSDAAATFKTVADSSTRSPRAVDIRSRASWRTLRLSPLFYRPTDSGSRAGSVALDNWVLWIRRVGACEVALGRRDSHSCRMSARTAGGRCRGVATTTRVYGTSRSRIGRIAPAPRTHPSVTTGFAPRSETGRRQPACRRPTAPWLTSSTAAGPAHDPLPVRPYARPQGRSEAAEACI